MKRLLMPLLALLMVPLFFGCEEKPEQEKEDTFSIYAENGGLEKKISFRSDASSKKLKLFSSSDWQVSTSPDWVVVEPASGKAGPGQISIAVTTNENSEKRSGELIFNSDGGKSQKISIVQMGGRGDDTPEPDPDKRGPSADLLDVIFHSDGTADDVSANAMNVELVRGANHMNYFSDLYERNIAHFIHAPGSNAVDGFYKVPYAGNQKFINALKDGHSMEVIFSCLERPSGKYELKMFTSHEGGGTGFLISNSNMGNCITFLPNVSSTGKSNWVWTCSGITPEPGRYYHVVGVWDKEKNKSFIYVDGELKATTDTEGELNLPNTDQCHWFGIGADATVKGGQAPWGGDIVVARIFDEALDADQVKNLFEDARKEQSQEQIHLGGLEFLTECRIPTGYWYHIFADGFKLGDQIRLESVSEDGVRVNCQTRIEKTGAAIKIPSNLTDGDYRIMLMRGKTLFPVGMVKIEIGEAQETGHKTQCVAHRCFHENGSSDKTWPENSLAAFKRTQELGVWGCEIDVWITRDDVVVVNHNESFPTDAKHHRIDNSTYQDLKDVKLANGESIPLLSDFLKQMKEESNLHLVLEIKSHSKIEDNERVADKCMEMVKAQGLADRIVWIAFSYDICKRIVKAMPDAMVMYLGGNIAPSVCKADGVMGIDYSRANLKDEWIKEAHDLGMVVNVWTINDAASMSNFIGKGVDYITTNEPDVLKDLLEKQFITKD